MVRSCSAVLGTARWGGVWCGSNTEGFILFPSLLDPFVGSDSVRCGVVESSLVGWGMVVRGY
jgi:hypothetical protein